MPRLHPDTESWIAAATDAGVVAARPLEGAATATVYRVDLTDGRRLVAKRFDRQDFLDERPDRAAHEAAVLSLLEPTPVPAPLLVAVDADGSAAGAPLVVMEWIEGVTNLPVGWVPRVTGNLADIHAVDPGPITWKYERYNADQTLFVPSWVADPAVWSDAFAIAAAVPPDTVTGFIHRDYHPGNLLWQGGRIVAVLDWLSGCVGPPAIDLAHLRTNLAMDRGSHDADAVLAAYGGDVWDPVWDVVDAVDFVPFYAGERAVELWRWDDRPVAETQARFDRWLTEAVRRTA